MCAVNLPTPFILIAYQIKLIKAVDIPLGVEGLGTGDVPTTSDAGML